MLSFVFLLGLFVSVESQSYQKCTVRGSPDFRPDQNDCSVFYVCANQILYKFNCPYSVFDPNSNTCVQEGSVYDRCTPQKDSQAEKLKCTPGSQAIIPHPTNCAQYYNCSGVAQGVKWESNLQECPHTQLFNAINKRCEHYTMVKCGERIEPISKCDYRANQCEAASCIPCNVRFSSCKNLPDGLNPWVGREGSPDFVVCKGRRVVYQGRCSQTFGPQVFDPKRKSCVQIKV